MKIFGRRRPSSSIISLRTSSVAVAVSAIVGGSPSILRTSPSRAYSGRKSCPQVLMQCASSTASNFGFNFASRPTKFGCQNRSGATYNNPCQPFSNRSEEHTSELQSPYDLVCRLLLEKKKKKK